MRRDPLSFTSDAFKEEKVSCVSFTFVAFN
jgi:hypothetical protein